MADTGERDVRDRLAEALWQGAARAFGRGSASWAEVQPPAKEAWSVEADHLLAALPAVGLRIGRVE